LKFVKMQGLGNDFVFVNCFEEMLVEDELPELARGVSDRHFGVGADGLILILPSDKADFQMRIFNADGGESEMCGNGMRCFARLVYEQGLTDRAEFTVETAAGIIVPRLVVDEGRVRAVRVDMGRPRFPRSEIPMRGEPGSRVVDRPLTAAGREFRVTCLSMGNPHCVIFVDDLERVDLAGWGTALERHEAFVRRTNVEFVRVLGPEELHVLVWERGAGATLACGTGACAAAVAAAIQGRTGRRVSVHLPGGRLEIEWAADDRVFMTGPCAEVFRGEYPGAPAREGEDTQWCRA